MLEIAIYDMRHNAYRITLHVTLFLEGCEVLFEVKEKSNEIFINFCYVSSHTCDRQSKELHQSEWSKYISTHVKFPYI